MSINKYIENSANKSGALLSEAKNRGQQYIEQSIRDCLEHLSPQVNNAINGIEFTKTDDMKKRDIQGKVANNVIYVSDNQSDPQDVLEDIYHELGHVVSGVHEYDIYQDNKLEHEFMSKRKRVANELKHSIAPDSVEIELMKQNPNYVREVDTFLYREIGYDQLRNYTDGIFLSPYAVTSLREYWADGFEDYFKKKDASKIERLCPVLYNKLLEVTQ